jgi:universal stress protein A
MILVFKNNVKKMIDRLFPSASDPISLPGLDDPILEIDFARSAVLIKESAVAGERGGGKEEPMLTIKTILCPTDFSEPSLHGLDTAVELAGLFKAELKVMYVLPLLPPSPTDPNFEFEVPEYENILHKDSEKKLDEIIKTKIPAAVKAIAVIGHGNAAKEIVRVAEEDKVDLIVIATHGHAGWHHLVMGSVAEKVIRHAPCPVYAVREHRQ